jgi:NAD(P)-dependent dehydrogenase (short-subunit alcohol dehydrogenase family)
MKGKVAVITGAAGGIGGEVAALFHAKGMLLVLADIDKKRLEAAARPYGEGALAVQCDITKPAEVKDLFRRAAKRFGGVDVLVNNAGIIVPNLFEDVTHAEVGRQVGVNLLGPINCAMEAVPYLKKRGGGNIVTISSLAGIVPETYSSIYTATKFALRGLGLTLHIELKRHNIHVSTVFPDSVDTPMLKFEAEHGGSPLTFRAPPQSPAAVAEAVYRAMVCKKPEVCVPAFDGFMSKLLMAFPRLVARLWPVFERQGRKKKEEFRARG